MTELSDFIEAARKVPLVDVFALVEGGKLCQHGDEWVGPCPACGGKDRFSINYKKGVFFCRQNDRESGDGLALVAHRHGLDLKRRAEFLEACSLVQGGRPIPTGGERETDDERAARERRNAERRAAAEAERARDEASGNRYRENSIRKGRGLYFNAGDGAGSLAEAYLKRRCGTMTLPAALWENLRFQPAQSYWHGKDARGHDIELHCGPALIAPFVDPVGQPGHITGCHQTWIDLGNGPKFRPALVDEQGARLPTKKMQGTKKGSVIPVLGDLDAIRWVGGEGIETVLAVAFVEGFRPDTFYFAAGDLGNLAGPADAGSGFSHPTLKKQDVKGVWKSVRVAGPMPKPDSEAECLQLPTHVGTAVLLADGDSEFIMTASAMARTEARLGRPGLEIATWWPRAGGDWADMLASAVVGQGRIVA